MTHVSDMTLFRTKDLNQAAFLWSQEGTKLLKLEGSLEGGNTIYFVLKLPLTEDDLAQLQLDYANGECSIEPKLFVSKQNSLRDLLHSSLGIQTSRKRQ